MSKPSLNQLLSRRPSRKPVVKTIDRLEADLVCELGEFYLAVRGLKINITRYKAQMINLMGSDFIVDLDCHQLNPDVYSQELAERMYAAFEALQRENFEAGVKAAVAILSQQPGWQSTA